MKTYISILLLAGACAIDGADDTSATIDELTDDGKADSLQRPRSFSCQPADGQGGKVKVTLVPQGETFDVTARSGDTVVFALASQRPSLNVAIEDGDDDVPSEFLDFRPSGLTAVPAIGLPKLELSLASGSKRLVYADPSTEVQLECRVNSSKLLAYLGIKPVRTPDVAYAQAVGLDIDDTLLFSTPTFTRAFATGGTPKPDDVVFWTQANRCDGGCPAEVLTLADGTIKNLPANEASGVKERVAELVRAHQEQGAKVYAITARPDISGDAVRAYVESALGIPAEDVFFEPDLDQPGNPSGKGDRIQQLGLDVFYGDADSDITDAQIVGVEAIRVLRSPKSSNRKDGRLNKYHPGYYGETIVAGSYD